MSERVVSEQKITVSMLVSRPVEMFRRALKSIMISQDPDELILFPSPSLEWDLEEELEDLEIEVRILQQSEAKITDDWRARTYYPKIESDFLLKKWKHTQDLVIRSVLEASHEWCRMCDDDDEMFFDLRSYVSSVPDNIGVINGDFYYCDFVRSIWEKRSGKGTIGYEKGAQGSTNCFRKKAVEEASRYWEPGPWPDYQLTFHMAKLGWTNLYVPEIFSIQHWHGNNSSRARSGYINWGTLRRNLEQWWNNNQPPSEVVSMVRERRKLLDYV